MSLVIGIKCIDGVVIASDSAATFGTAELETIQQTANKICQPTFDTICAIAGSAGLSQLYTAGLGELLQTTNFRGLPQHEQVLEIEKMLSRILETRLQVAKILSTGIDKTEAYSECLAETLVALSLNNGPRLLTFHKSCAGQEVTDDLMFACFGVGQKYADPFLAFLKRVIWDDRQPTLAIGVFSAVWTIKHALLSNSAGLRYPICVRTLRNPHGTPLVETPDIDTILKHVVEAERRVAGVRDLLNPLYDAEDDDVSTIPGPDELQVESKAPAE